VNDVEARDELDQLREQIRDLERRLREVSAIKHEISNILMGLMGHTELLANSTEPPEKSRKRAKLIYAQCQRIKEEIKALAKLTGGT